MSIHHQQIEIANQYSDELLIEVLNIAEEFLINKTEQKEKFIKRIIV